jgi:hypothetical protein
MPRPCANGSVVVERSFSPACSSVLHDHAEAVDNHEDNHSCRDAIVLDSDDRHHVRHLEDDHEGDQHQ